MHVSLPLCWPAHLLACLPSYVPADMLACVHYPAWHSFFLLSCMQTSNMSARPTCLEVCWSPFWLSLSRPGQPACHAFYMEFCGHVFFTADLFDGCKPLTDSRHSRAPAVSGFTHLSLRVNSTPGLGSCPAFSSCGLTMSPTV